jgi:SAM-dependent methyltransferase
MNAAGCFGLALVLSLVVRAHATGERPAADMLRSSRAIWFGALALVALTTIAFFRVLSSDFLPKEASNYRPVRTWDPVRKEGLMMVPRKWTYSKGSCPACESRQVNHFAKVDGYDYFLCDSCKLISIDPSVLAESDDGLNIRKYDAAYWEMELRAAMDRAYGQAIERTAEVIYYTRIPIKRFVDIGSGPGYFLDAINQYLPSRASRFYGVELFPPPIQHRTKHQNYLVGDLRDVSCSFDSGLCMEVAEHLTPLMLRTLLEDIVAKSNPGGCFMFNTGLSEYVQKEDPGYLDPTKRGHLVSWSVDAVRVLCEGLELDVFPIRGKRWAFVVERRSVDGERARDIGGDIRGRVWYAHPENLELLTDPEMGSVLKILGRLAILAYS